jgi:glycosyltransferase involved in cell wall biosynthesis
VASSQPRRIPPATPCPSRASRPGARAPRGGTGRTILFGEALNVCFPFRGNVIGGSHLSSLLLIKELRARGVGARVMVHAEGPLSNLLDDYDMPWDLLELPVAVWSPSRRLQVQAAPSTLFTLRRYLARHDVEIVHTNDGRMHRLWGSAAQLCKVRWVLHHRTRELTSMMAALARSSDALVTISAYSGGRLPRSLAARARIIDNPFDTTAEPPDRNIEHRRLAAELGVDRDTPIVGFVSNLRQARKRPYDFVEMAAILRNEFDTQAHFPMFGAVRPETARSVREQAERTGVGQSLRLMGSRIPIEPHIAACDLIIVPAEEEPFGRTLVEASLVGTPVVASDSGGHPEIVDHGRTGLLFPPKDTERGAREAARLLRDRGFAGAIAAAARRDALDRFSTARHADAVIAMYRGVLGANPCPDGYSDTPSPGGAS